MDRARVDREVTYLANRLAREENERALAKQKDNEPRFCQLSHHSTLIKVRLPLILAAILQCLLGAFRHAGQLCGV